MKKWIVAVQNVWKCAFQGEEGNGETEKEWKIFHGRFDGRDYIFFSDDVFC